MILIILYVLLAVIVAGAVAYAVVKFVPRKLLWIVSLILLLLIFVMARLNYKSIMKPIKFAKEKKARYSKVITNLKTIRDAEIAYNKNNNHYTADKNALIAFIDTGRFAVTKVETKIKKVRRGAIYENVERRVEKIIGYTDVKAEFAGRNYKNMFKVPGTDVEFEIKVDSLEKVEGIMSSLFEAKVDKALVLAGMDDYLILEEKEAIGGTQVRGKFISVGSLEDVKISGNWPPIYDSKKDLKDK